MLEALADSAHPDHDKRTEWLGDYDPDAVNVPAINERFARIAEWLAAPKTAPA